MKLPQDRELQKFSLIFEEDDGVAEKISPWQIRKAFKEFDMPDLVILQACHSEKIGDAFLEIGASHVICIRKDREILDEVSREFTSLLY